MQISISLHVSLKAFSIRYQIGKFILLLARLANSYYAMGMLMRHNLVPEMEEEQEEKSLQRTV